MAGPDLAKRALDRLADLEVRPLAASYEVRRRLVGPERAYQELSERAARWPGIHGERRRLALHRALGTEIGDRAILRLGCVLKRPPLSIGALTVIGYYAQIQHASIGAHCLIGDFVVIVDGNRQHNIDRLDVPLYQAGGPIEVGRIGDGCLVGVTSVVLAPLGDHVVVGAGSVVTEPVDDYQIVVGNPARVVGDRREQAERRRARADRS